MRIVRLILCSTILLAALQLSAQLSFESIDRDLNTYTLRPENQSDIHASYFSSAPIKSGHFNIASNPGLRKFLSAHLILSLEGGMEHIDARSFISSFHPQAEQYDRFTMGGSASIKLGYLNIFQYERKRRASSFEYSYPTGSTVPYRDPIIGITTMVKESNEVTIKIRTTENLFKFNLAAIKAPFTDDGSAGGLYVVYGKSRLKGNIEQMNVYGLELAGFMKENKISGWGFGFSILYYDARNLYYMPGFKNVAFNMSIGYGIGS